MSFRIAISVILLLFLYLKGFPQQAYFVDGYHGGVYGHYPLFVTSFVVDELNKHQEWKIGLEIEPETWDTVLAKDAEGYRKFKKMFSSGRMEFTNLSYAQPYCYNISGESIIRQFQFGMQKTKEHFPDVTFTSYAVQEPCFTSALPQLLKQFGLEYAVLKTTNTAWGGYTGAYGGQLVNWVGPDGTAIPTVPRYAVEEFEDHSTWQTKAWNNDMSFLQASYDAGILSPVGMCYQDAGWKNGPWLGSGNSVKNDSKYILWTEYFKDIANLPTEDNWHFSQEDIHVNLMWGTSVLQRIARQVRRAENNISTAEKINTIAFLDNRLPDMDSDFRSAWRTLLLAQHHDAWIVPYNNLKEDQTWAEAVESWTANTNRLSAGILERSMASYQKDRSKEETHLGKIRVFNPVATHRSEVVSVAIPFDFSEKKVALYDTKGKNVPYSAEHKTGKWYISFRPIVSGLGFSTYVLKEHAHRQSIRASGVRFDREGNCIMENDQYILVLDKQRGGTIKSLIAKHADDREFITDSQKFALNEIAGHFYKENKTYSSVQSVASFTIIQDNPFQMSVKVSGLIASHPFSQVITLESGHKKIDVQLDIAWQNRVGIGEYEQTHSWRDNRRAHVDDRYKLKVMFPTNLNAPALFKNAPFDVFESRLENTFFSTWDSIKHNVILNWIDLYQQNEGYGLALLTDHTTSYSFGKDYPLSITAQYSGKGLWGWDYRNEDSLTMHYALIPHEGKWDEASISSYSACWNEPLVANYSTDFLQEDRSILSFTQNGLEVSSMQLDQGDVLLRIFNAEGDQSSQKVKLDFPVSKIEEELLDGTYLSNVPVERHNDKSIFRVSMPRFGIKTLRIIL